VTEQSARRVCAALGDHEIEPRVGVQIADRERARARSVQLVMKRGAERPLLGLAAALEPLLQ
jgi:hypothetical protein